MASGRGGEQAAHRKILVTKVPRGARNSVASRSASSTRADCVYASLLQAPPTLGAPSWITVSAGDPPSAFLRSCSARELNTLSKADFLFHSRNTSLMVSCSGQDHNGPTQKRLPASCGLILRPSRAVAGAQKQYDE